MQFVHQESLNLEPKSEGLLMGPLNAPRLSNRDWPRGERSVLSSLSRRTKFGFLEALWIVTSCDLLLPIVTRNLQETVFFAKMLRPPLDYF